MATHDSLKSLVRQYIKTNGQNEITGQILQNVLIAMIDELGITIDPTPTKNSSDAVSSGGTFGALQQLNEINATLSSDGKIYNNYQAGDIYYTEQNSVRVYWVALADGEASEVNPVTISDLNFYHAENATDAVRMSLSTKTFNIDAYTKQESDAKYQPKGNYQPAGDYATEQQLAGKANASDVYTKSETYSKTELDNLITTPNQQYVSVTATAQTTAITDLLPATGAADTIYRVGNWDGTQYDPTMYALFAWNGTSYVCLAVRSFVDEVYDVSVNHPDGQGNPTPYADLTAALGSNGVNIPADIRRGGMSIKFIQGNVQSSDNKYVQYFLAKKEWSASKADWQKMNLEEEVSQLGQKVVNNSWTGNGNTFSKTKIVGLRPGATYRLYLRKIPWDMTGVTVTGVTKLAIQHFYNGSQTADLLQVSITAELRQYYDFTIPANSDYIAVGGRAAVGEIVDWNIVDLTLIKQKADLVPYFAALSVPQFLDVDLSTPALKVKFPLNPMRLYDSFGASLIGDYSGAVNQTFTLSNLQSLVWDFADSSVKVVGTGTAGNYVHLLNLARNSVTGLFAGWFNEQKWKDNNPTIAAQKAANTLGEAIFASKTYEISPSTASFAGLVEVGVPYNRKFVFRVNDPNGTLRKVSDLAGYDYDGNNVPIATINIQTNTDYEYYAPKGLASLRVWVGSSFMTGESGTITIQVTIPSQYDDESIVRRWNDSDKLVVRDNLLKDADFKALFFSDIHGYTAELSRIIALGNDWKSLLDCIIDTGDDTASYQSASPLTWYNDLAQTSELPIVRAAGNHDAWTTNYNVWATKQELYEYFTDVAVAQLTAKGATVVQPSDAATAYKNYYYVDFGSVRMIVITSLTGGGYYDSDQATWFASVLNDARTNNKSVICLNHAPMPLISSVENVESNWCSYKTRTSDGTIMEQDPLDKVDAFIRAGGKFVCWFTGHTHIDYVMKFSKTIDGVTKTQFCFTTSTASQAGPIDAVRQKSNRDNGFDLFNMVGIDLTNHLVKIWRIGLNTNQYLQLHNTFVWDYVNNRIVSD